MLRWPMAVVRFYVDGFRGMGWLGKNLWLLIIIKLVLIFAVMKLFFFPDLLQTNYSTDAERAQAVRTHLSAPEKSDVAVTASQPADTAADGNHSPP